MKKQTSKRTISFLTQEETKRLFSAIKNKRDRAIFLTAYRHGLRTCEIGYCPRNASAP
jgi:integrase